MKKILYIFSTLLLLAGCRQESMHYEIPQPEDALHLRASRDSVVLAQRYAGEDAITFTWDTPEPLEGTTGYDYYFKMDIAGNGFETSISKLSVKGMQSLSFTHAELNAMLEQWGVSPSTWMQIEAELIANPLGSETYIKPMLSTVTFDAVGFANYMYIAGSATAAGYDYANALVMDKIAGENAYTYRGVLQPGEFFFLMEQSDEADFIGMGRMEFRQCFVYGAAERDAPDMDGTADQGRVETGLQPLERLVCRCFLHRYSRQCQYRGYHRHAFPPARDYRRG